MPRLPFCRRTESIELCLHSVAHISTQNPSISNLGGTATLSAVSEWQISSYLTVTGSLILPRLTTLAAVRPWCGGREKRQWRWFSRREGRRPSAMSATDNKRFGSKMTTLSDLRRVRTSSLSGDSRHDGVSKDTNVAISRPPTLPPHFWSLTGRDANDWLTDTRYLGPARGY